MHSLKCASAQVTVPGADPRAEEPARLLQSPPATAGAAGPGRSGATEAGACGRPGPRAMHAAGCDSALCAPLGANQLTGTVAVTSLSGPGFGA